MCTDGQRAEERCIQDVAAKRDGLSGKPAFRGRGGHPGADEDPDPCKAGSTEFTRKGRRLGNGARVIGGLRLLTLAQEPRPQQKCGIGQQERGHAQRIFADLTDGREQQGRRQHEHQQRSDIDGAGCLATEFVDRSIGGVGHPARAVLARETFRRHQLSAFLAVVVAALEPEPK